LTAARWEVGCRLEFDVTEPARMAVLVAAARAPGLQVTDTLSVWVDGQPDRVRPTILDDAAGERTHLLELPVGAVAMAYDAEVIREATSASDAPAPLAPVSVAEQLRFLRPSRYCPSDRLAGWARREFGVTDPESAVDASDPAQAARAQALAQRIASWVFERTDYVLGSSDGTDSAIDTLLSSQGVCRDFAHLVITICRALDLPARLVAVYAPGLFPMDFHAVAEVCIAGQWLVHDATALAPRRALVRVATGRDAADTAFITVDRGQAELTASTVTAVIDGDLPADADTNGVILA
jgi:transglutaminase-like putative cysteine protease